jgi:ribosomal protein L37E
VNLTTLICSGCTGEEKCIVCERSANRGRRWLAVDPHLCSECGARLVGVQRITCTDCTFGITQAAREAAA